MDRITRFLTRFTKAGTYVARTGPFVFIWISNKVINRSRRHRVGVLTGAVSLIAGSIAIWQFFSPSPSPSPSPSSPVDNAISHLEVVMDEFKSDGPRFLESYVPEPETDPFRNRAYTYDNALALSAFVAHHDCRRAEGIAEAFLSSAFQDQQEGDLSLRDWYAAKEMVAPPDVTTSTFSNAWAVIALLNYHDICNDGKKYLDLAKRLGKAIARNARNEFGIGYFSSLSSTGTSSSIEEIRSDVNLVVFAAFQRLYSSTNELIWSERAFQAKAFLAEMWTPAKGAFVQSTLSELDPLNVHAWSLLALGENRCTRQSVAYVTSRDRYLANHKQFTAFQGFVYDHSVEQRVPWPEGTAYMTLVYHHLERAGDRSRYLESLRTLQAQGRNSNGKGIVANPGSEPIDTGISGFQFYNLLHVAATSWFIFSELDFNPFWPPDLFAFDELSDSFVSVCALIVPQIVQVNYPTSVRVSEIFEIEVEARTRGSISPEGHLHIAFPDQVTLKSVKSVCLDGDCRIPNSPGPPPEYSGVIFALPGEKLFCCYGSGDRVILDYPVVIGRLVEWPDEQVSRVTVTLDSEDAGILRFEVKFTVHPASPDKWLGAPSVDSAQYPKDQQNERVQVHEVQVLSSELDLHSPE